MSDAKFGFEMRRLRLVLDDILPDRRLKDPQNEVGRYRASRASTPSRATAP